MVDFDRGVYKVVKHRMRGGGVNGDCPHCMSAWPWKWAKELTEYIRGIVGDHW